MALYSVEAIRIFSKNTDHTLQLHSFGNDAEENIKKSFHLKSINHCLVKFVVKGLLNRTLGRHFSALDSSWPNSLIKSTEIVWRSILYWFTYPSHQHCKLSSLAMHANVRFIIRHPYGSMMFNWLFTTYTK